VFQIFNSADLIAADVVVTVEVALIGVSDFKSADVMVTVEVTLIRVPELIAAGCSGHRRGRIDRCFRSLIPPICATQNGGC
jgi:hypothetical protein